MRSPGHASRFASGRARSTPHGPRRVKALSEFAETSGDAFERSEREKQSTAADASTTIRSRQRHAGPRRARLERATLVRRAFRAQGAQLETQEERDDEHAQKAGGDDADAASGQGRKHGEPLRVRPGEKRWRIEVDPARRVPGLVVHERRGIEDDERPRREGREDHARAPGTEQPDTGPPAQGGEEDRREVVEEARAEDAPTLPLGVPGVEQQRGEPYERERAQPPRDLARPAPRPRERPEREDEVRRVHEESARGRDEEPGQTGRERRVERLDAVAPLQRRAEREVVGDEKRRGRPPRAREGDDEAAPPEAAEGPRDQARPPA